MKMNEQHTILLNDSLMQHDTVQEHEEKFVLKGFIDMLK